MEENFIVIRNFIDKETCKMLKERTDQFIADDLYMKDDPQCPTSESFYSVNYDVLEKCTEKVQEISGLDLEPAYEYSRRYWRGSVLERHSDRPSCQYSVTYNIANSGDPWPIYMGNTEEETHCIILEPGDGVLYKGCDIQHWRNKLVESDLVYQSFLHYVDMNGEYAENAYEYMKRKPSNICQLVGIDVNP